MTGLMYDWSAVVLPAITLLLISSASRRQKCCHLCSVLWLGGRSEMDCTCRWKHFWNPALVLLL